MDSESQPEEPTTSIGALLKLLTDESKSTQKAATKALTELGAVGIRALEHAAGGEDPKLRGRARQALLAMAKKRGRTTLTRMLAVDAGAHGPDEPELLIEGLLAIDEILGFQEFEADDAQRCLARAQIDAWADAMAEAKAGADAWREAPTLAGAGALRRILSDAASLAGPERDFHNLQHVSLNRTIVTKTGLPLTLSAIYAAVARRNGLEAWLLPFPGQVLLGLGPPSDRVIVDPFHGGVLLSRSTCLARLASMGAPPSPDWLEPATDRAMLVRQTRNLAAAMRRHGREREASLFARLVGDA